MEKKLFEYNNLIKIQDFDDAEIDRYLHRYLEGNQTKITEIKKYINSDTVIQQLSRKPLFLNVIYSNFKKLQNYRIINESAFLSILTDKWIHHDSKIREESNLEKKESLINSRKEISKILAFAKKGIDEPIGIDDIKAEVSTKLGEKDPDAVDKLEEYYKDAVSSTFLIKEENQTYRFILNPVREFFIARRIVDDINNNDPESILEHVKIISSNETFDFIKGIIDIEWAIKPHVLPQSLEELKNIQIPDDVKTNFENYEKKLLNFENKSYVLLSTIERIRDKKIRYNASNLLKILLSTGNVPKRINLSNLDLSGANIPNMDFTGSNLSNSNLSNANLRGVNFSEANLTNCKLESSNLTGVVFSNANLTSTKLRNSNVNNAIFFESIVKQTDFTKANLSHSNFQHAEIDNARFYYADLTYSKLGSLDFGKLNVKGVILMGTDLSQVRLTYASLDDCDFRGTVLSGLNLSNSKLRHAKFNGVDLTRTELHNSDLSHADMSGSTLTHTDIDRAILTDVHNLPISFDEAVERGAIF
ncbi:MAG: pentapeptide repeat-containing protein [Nitrosopumilus sp.]